VHSLIDNKLVRNVFRHKQTHASNIYLNFKNCYTFDKCTMFGWEGNCLGGKKDGRGIVREGNWPDTLISFKNEMDCIWKQWSSD